MQYETAIEFLHRLGMFGARFGLETTLRLAALAGDPHKRLRFIHVAGTNGKGSTCALLESVYRAAGLRVGLFTSPHLVRFGERIQVNRENIPDEDVARLVGELRGKAEATPDFQFPGGGGTAERSGFCPTFFEFVTVLALRHFAERNCDLVIWETGLGGRLDATNIVTPLASVITNVQFDHQQWLGETLGKIATEKAGIIKRGIPILTAAAEPEALAVIREAASRNDAPLTEVSGRDARKPPLDSIRLPLAGEHQRLNAALAVATIRALDAAIPVHEEALRAGLERVHWPGRLQVFHREERTILLDGAHNPAGAETLRAALGSLFPGVKPAFILGAMRDKDWAGMCRILAPLASRAFIAPVASERSATPDELCGAFAAANDAVKPEPCGSLREALHQARGEPFTVITGSLQFLGEAMELLEAPSLAAREERRLNEWTAAADQRAGK